MKNTEFDQFVLAMESRVSALSSEIKKLDADEQPQVHQFIKTQMQASSDLLFKLTGSLATEFKQLLNK